MRSGKKNLHIGCGKNWRLPLPDKKRSRVSILGSRFSFEWLNLIDGASPSLPICHSFSLVNKEVSEASRRVKGGLRLRAKAGCCLWSLWGCCWLLLVYCVEGTITVNEFLVYPAGGIFPHISMEMEIGIWSDLASWTFHLPLTSIPRRRERERANLNILCESIYLKFWV